MKPVSETCFVFIGCNKIKNAVFLENDVKQKTNTEINKANGAKDINYNIKSMPKKFVRKK